jgi:glycosyltransferase involved in cell wall biosynthesis
MFIIQVNASYKPAYIYGGPTMSVSKLSEELIKAGKDVEVFTTVANGESELNIKAGRKTLIDGVPVTYFRRITRDPSHLSPALLLHLFNTLKSRFRIGQFIIDNTNFPIVHIHAWWNLVSVGSCLISLLTSRPVILSPRGTLSSYSFGNRKSIIKNIFHNIIGKALLKSCHFHVTSEKEKQDILSIVEPKSIVVIPNFIDYTGQKNQSPQSRNLTSQTQIFRLLFLSRVEEKKGLDFLLHSLHNIDLPYHLTIAGTGDVKYLLYLEELIVKLDMLERVSWIGQLSNDRKFSELANHDLMVLPSHDESFANVVIESLSVGTPVLISSKVGLASYVLTNNFGWVYTMNDNQLGSALVEAFTDIKRRNLIREVAPQQIRLDFDDKCLVKSYNQMYTRIFSMHYVKYREVNTF